MWTTAICLARERASKQKGNIIMWKLCLKHYLYPKKSVCKRLLFGKRSGKAWLMSVEGSCNRKNKKEILDERHDLPTWWTLIFMQSILYNFIDILLFFIRHASLPFVAFNKIENPNFKQERVFATFTSSFVERFPISDTLESTIHGEYWNQLQILTLTHHTHSWYCSMVLFHVFFAFYS